MVYLIMYSGGDLGSVWDQMGLQWGTADLLNRRDLRRIAHCTAGCGNKKAEILVEHLAVSCIGGLSGYVCRSNMFKNRGRFLMGQSHICSW